MLPNIQSPVTHRIYRANLKKKIATAHQQIRDKISVTGSQIVHRTQATNAKRHYQTFKEEQTARQEILSEQIKLWRRTLHSHAAIIKNP